MSDVPTADVSMVESVDTYTNVYRARPVLWGWEDYVNQSDTVYNESWTILVHRIITYLILAVLASI